MKRLLPLLLAFSLAVGAGSAGAAPANPLAPLVVPQAQLGKLAQGLEVELLSGTTTNARAADDSFDPNDTAATVSSSQRPFRVGAIAAPITTYDRCQIV